MKVAHLWRCAERRALITYEGCAFVALCGKTKPRRLRLSVPPKKFRQWRTP
jgi:hypothetical protein